MFNRRLKRVVKVEESEKRFREQLEKEKLEKKDIPAMIIAALLTFLPALILVIGLVLLVSWLLFGRG